VVLNPTYGFSQESPLHLNLQKHRIRKETRRMICPFCRHDDSRVVDSRPADDGSQIRRRRECTDCGARFTTQETTLLNIVKRSGASEPFSREKVIAGVTKACQGRPVNDDDLALLAMRVEETLRATGQAEIEAQEVGLAILAPLRELDEVAYLRFASVYRSFSSLEDFEGEIALLRAAPSTPASKNSPEKSTSAVTSSAK
jgi:transcriptional repressor NrdR